ncbi:glycoside hydrolase family 16 protein [Salegentibacter salegens]|uniref:Glycosyl hydrolases family 16 n=1 Tax=Salegentibacter salegens TaxID=143223 RepID=A0A1M7NJQ1_9FLAO|nr:glycoside hydrolase family 16 protein [Salegentibacter salegens]PRX39830.1 glycosyl hydrolase family 16 [Salegentibacter salegens]SHN04082.1 Glycosyl hydrolases family 16 [Salegentibacter salegens]
MKKNKFYFNLSLPTLIFCLFLLSCSSTDDSPEAENGSKKDKTMEIPNEDNIDWEDVVLVWAEEYNEPVLSTDIWFFESKNTTNPDVTDQLQIYQEENATLDEGTLKINARKNDGVYTSARLSSHYTFKYGRIEISAKLPEQEKKGIWAKFALFGENIETVGWPEAGEIDMMEYFSHKPNETYINVHTAINNTKNGTLISANNYLETVEEEFHAYGILWTDQYIKFYVDDPDKVIYTLNKPSSPTEENWPFDNSFYFLIDMVIGGRYGGAEGVDDSLFPAVMEIDYIRVYHLQ